MDTTNWNDTIVAPATAPGLSAIGVIRISGTESFSIMKKLFPSKDLQGVPSHTIHLGYFKYNNTILDEVLVSVFKNPKSYTGEDVVEISCHGSPFIQQQIINAITASGARMAKPGEFTQRAFLHGKLDLTQAEAVADLIASNSLASQNAALHNMRGGFKNVLSHLREELITFSALIELELDFAEEDVEFADRTKLYQLLKELETTTNRLIDSFASGNVVKNGVSVAIIGKPNAGKSTLLNAMLNEDRAIVSAIAGTTRDTIEEALTINGVLFRLIDTAGIREHTTDIIEQFGIEKSRETLQKAELVLYIFDAVEMDIKELYDIIAELTNAGKKYILIANKTDQLSIAAFTEKYTTLPDCLPIIARDQIGITALKEAVYKKIIHTDLQHEAVLITNARHFDVLQKLQTAIADIHLAIDNKVPTDLIALDIRLCLNYIAELTGELSNENVLDYIFSKFCIGK
jgi:tRNA modification GTPase